MKKRISIAVSVFLVLAGLVLPPFALDMHLLFSRQGGFTWRPTAGWAAVIAGGKPARLYFYLCAALVLMLLWAIVSSSYIKYRSGMIQVTPDIETPAPAGQGQFGTARWLDRQNISRYYTSVCIDKKGLATLEEAGEKSYQEAENANVKIE